MHNHYAVLYNETVFAVLEEVRGPGEALVFARATHTSGQRLPVHWGGDSHSTFESMAASLRGGLSLGLCGFGYWSHDIGGFEGLPPPAVYKRWVAFGLLSSHSRLHGSSSYRVPWHYNGEACDVLRLFTKLKCRLMPYLYGAALEAHREGWPMMRAMLLEFPDDPACAPLDAQYLLGPALLVAPVLSDDGVTDTYLPAGRWTHLLTGEIQTGGRWHRAQHDFFSLPLWVRPGSVLPIGAVDNRPDYDFAADVTFRVYELADGAELTGTVPDLRGAAVLRLAVRRAGRRITATVDGTHPGRWHLQLAGARAAAISSPAATRDDPLGVILSAEPGARRLDCELPATPPEH
jgi:alpha-D-xyloside xylohydrolase